MWHCELARIFRAISFAYFICLDKVKTYFSTNWIAADEFHKQSTFL